MSKLHDRPTAMVVTLIALSFVLADSAVAETDTVARAISTARVKRIARGVANQEISKRAPGLSVGSAVSAQSANPVLFARVAADGTVDPANSKGIAQADVTNPRNGLYCFSGPPGVRGGQVTPDFNENLTDNIAQFGLGTDAFNNCAATTTQFFVVIINANAEGGVGANGGFFLHLYQ